MRSIVKFEPLLPIKVIASSNYPGYPLTVTLQQLTCSHGLDQQAKAFI